MNRLEPDQKKHHTGFGDPIPSFVAGNYSACEADKVLGMTLQHFRLTCSGLTAMFARFPNVKILRLIDVQYESDTNFIPTQNQLKNLILVHTKLTPVLSQAAPKLDSLEFSAIFSGAPLPATFEVNHLDLESFVANSNFLREVWFDHVKLVGEPTTGLHNDAIMEVHATDEITKGVIKGYFPFSDLKRIEDEE